MGSAMLPAPIRLHNPGRLPRDAQRFTGALNKADDEAGLIRFIAPIWGIRALAKTLIALQRRGGCVTLGDLMRQFRPDDPLLHMSVGRALACRLNQPFDCAAPAQMLLLVQALIRFDHAGPPGEARAWYPLSTLALGIGMALGTLAAPPIAA